MPGGVHLLIGLILTLFINFFLRRTKNGTKLTTKEEKERSEDSENMKLGFVVGGILPDGDICLVILVLIFTYTCLGYGLETNRFLAELIHRSFTHSFFVLFPILGYIVYKYHYCDTRTQKILGFQVNLPFALGCVVSMIVHTVFDTCYMKGVRFLFPLFNEEIFFEIPSLGLYEFEKYGPILQKFLLTFDHLTEVMFYCLLMWARSRMHHTNVDTLSNPERRSNLFRDFNIARIWRELTEQDWQHIFKYVCTIQTILLWVWFAIGLFVVPMYIERQMHYDEYMVFLYFPGTVFLIVSLLSPLSFSSVIRRWDWKTVIKGRSKTMRYADGAIMKETCTLSCCSSSHAIKQE